MDKEKHEPALSPAELAEREIMEHDDAVEWVLREAHGIGNILWSAIESVTANKRVTTLMEYKDLYDGKEFIGRQVVAYEKTIGDVGEHLDIRAVQVSGSRQRGE